MEAEISEAEISQAEISQVVESESTESESPDSKAESEVKVCRYIMLVSGEYKIPSNCINSA